MESYKWDVAPINQIWFNDKLLRNCYSSSRTRYALNWYIAKFTFDMRYKTTQINQSVHWILQFSKRFDERARENTPIWNYFWSILRPVVDFRFIASINKCFFSIQVLRYVNCLSFFIYVFVIKLHSSWFNKIIFQLKFLQLLFESALLFSSVNVSE